MNIIGYYDIILFIALYYTGRLGREEVIMGHMLQKVKPVPFFYYLSFSTFQHLSCNLNH